MEEDLALAPSLSEIVELYIIYKTIEIFQNHPFLYFASLVTSPLSLSLSFPSSSFLSLDQQF